MLDMADLSKVLGDVYGNAAKEDDRAAPASEAAPVYSPASSTAPTWADEARLDEAFANWNPGPGPDAPAAERDLFVATPAIGRLDDDLAAALSEALADAPTTAVDPAPSSAVPPISSPDERDAPVATTPVPARPPASPNAAWLADVIRPDIRPATPIVDPAAAPEIEAPEIEAPVAEAPPSPAVPMPIRSWQRDDDDVLVRHSSRGGSRLTRRRRG